MSCGSGNWPNLSGLIASQWGSGPECAAFFFSLSGGSNIVVGSNPAYSIADFLNFYPKYAGPPAVVTGALTMGSPTVSDIIVPSSTTAPTCFPPPVIAAGQLVTGNGIPPNTTIASVESSSSLTLSQNATASATGQISIFTQPLLPIFVINTYITLASASLVKARWFDSWYTAMAYYVGHYCTLYLRSEGNADTTPGAAAVAGLKQGMTVASSAGGVSQSTQLVPGLDDWGAWNQTGPGVLFATMAKSVGAGPVLVY